MSPRRVVRLLAIALAVAPGAAAAQRPHGIDTLLTRAERTGYSETSRYDDVMEFLRAVAAGSPLMHLVSFGYSYEGRALPLMVYGRVGDGSPAAVRAAGGTRIYIQAEAHGGEAAGKEALLALLRGLASGARPRWADSLVLLIAPVLNADGNDRVTLTNRPLQYGPVGGVGQRFNLQGLDIDRDFTKLETPEARSVVSLLNRYDPQVVLDLHTSGGVVEGYRLTVSPPLTPDADPVLDTFARRVWLPALAEEIRRKHGWQAGFEGTLPGPGSDRRWGWYARDPLPRHLLNYVALRGRFAIRASVYAYDPFQDRIMATLRFLDETIAFAAVHASEISRLTAQADQKMFSGSYLSLRAHYRDDARTGTVLLGDVAHERDPLTGLERLHREGPPRPARMPIFDAYTATDSVRLPRAYLVPAELGDVIDRLDAHGIRYTRLAAATALSVGSFAMDSTWLESQTTQRHARRRFTGAWRTSARSLPPGTVVVPTDQPLGRLAAYLLEPRAEDGLASWNLLDRDLDGGRKYPIFRTVISVR